MGKYRYAEVLYPDRMCCFITDGDPYLTARSMGTYISIRVSDIPDGDGCKPADEGGEQSPRELADGRYEELAQRVASCGENAERGRVEDGVSAWKRRLHEFIDRRQ